MWVVLVWFCKSGRKRCNQAAKHQAWRTPKQVLQEIWRLPWSDALLRQEIDVAGSHNLCKPYSLLHFRCSSISISCVVISAGPSSKTMAKPKVSRHTRTTFWKARELGKFSDAIAIRILGGQVGISVWHCNSMFMKTLPHLVEYSWGIAFHFLILSYSSIWFFAPSIRPEVCPQNPWISA